MAQLRPARGTGRSMSDTQLSEPRSGPARPNAVHGLFECRDKLPADIARGAKDFGLALASCQDVYRHNYCPYYRAAAACPVTCGACKILKQRHRTQATPTSRNASTEETLLLATVARDAMRAGTSAGVTAVVQLHTPLQDGFRTLDYMLPRYAQPACVNLQALPRQLTEEEEPPLSPQDIVVMQNGCQDCVEDDVVCSCNATHRVQYTSRGDPAHADIFVYDTHGTRRPRIPVSRRNRSNLLLLVEPAAHVDFKYVSGFTGLLSYHREHALVWRPFHMPSEIQQAVGELARQPLRRKTDIGMWVDNCHSKFRQPIWSALNASGLPFASYGTCCPTRPATLGIHLWEERAAALCRRHRLYVAVENNACADWVSEHIYQAIVRCGAIPIVKTHRGLPDYAALYGRLPLVDAARDGWLETVRRLMTDDDYYRAFLASYASGGAGGAGGGSGSGRGGGGGTARPSTSSSAGWPQARGPTPRPTVASTAGHGGDGKGSGPRRGLRRQQQQQRLGRDVDSVQAAQQWHCQFFDKRLHGARPPAERRQVTRWPQCVTNNEVSALA